MKLFGKSSGCTCAEELLKLRARVQDLERSIGPLTADMALAWEKVDKAIKRLSQRQREAEKASETSLPESGGEAGPQLSRAEKLANLRRRVIG